MGKSVTTLLGLSLILYGKNAYAFDYRTANGIDIRFDNAFEYGLVERTAPESSYFANNPNTNDGDNNLKAGIVSNRLDLLTQFSISYNNYGFATSIASFYDSIYNQNTQNRDNFTYNPATEPADKFTQQTRTRAGRDIELRNLFVYGTHDVFGIPATLRVGRFVNLFGESLLFPLNGISYGQAPLDVERAISVPNTQAKDLFLPVGQASLTLQLTNTWSLTGYYQFQWQPFFLPPAGSYFSTVDFMTYGGQRIFAGPAGPGANAYFYRTNDITGSFSGQFGVAVHYDPVNMPIDIGLYALQYNDSEPQIYVHPYGIPSFIPGVSGKPNALSVGSYQLVFPNHIQIYGASFSRTFGPLNLAGEMSARVNDPLNSGAITIKPGVFADNGSHAMYAKGTTIHYQLSEIYDGQAGKFWNGYSVIGEVAADNLIAITKNSWAWDRATSRHMALGLRTVGTLNYYQVLPGVDLNPNLGIGWNFMGMAPDTTAFNNTGIDRGGDITIALQAIYKSVWNANVGYTRYIAPPGRDPYADRDYAFFNVQHTF